jgi:phosphatidylinositol alpha-1,6-mannosyltransferase
LLVATTDFPPARGGIQRVLDELTHRLSERWTITVVASRQRSSASFDSTTPFQVLRTATAWEESPRAVLYEMTRLIARRRFDLLLAGHMNTLPAVFIAGRGAPAVGLIYGNELWGLGTRIVTRLLGGRLDRAMAISRFTAREAAKAGIPAHRLVIVPLGASPPPPLTHRNEILDRFGLSHEGRVVPFFLTVSRLAEPHKGHDVFLRALPSVLSRHPDVRYVIAGSGPLAQDLSMLANKLGIGHAVQMPGDVDEFTKAVLMSECRAFVMPSRESRRPALFEGFGIVYIEAAMAGRPSLAGASGGVAVAVIHGQTGLLVDPESVADVADGALRLLGDPAYADALGQRARDRALRDHTWSAAIDRMERCMKTLLDSPAPESSGAHTPGP